MRLPDKLFRLKLGLGDFVCALLFFLGLWRVVGVEGAAKWSCHVLCERSAVPVLFLLCKGVRLRAGEEALWVRRGLLRFGVLGATAESLGCLLVLPVGLFHWDIFNVLLVGVMGM